jgi:DNA-binding beta-propeller fold protein YncE
VLEGVMARRGLWTTLAVVFVLFGGRAGIRSAPLADAGAAAQDEAMLYVCVQDDAKVAVVDMARREVLRSIDLTALGFSDTAKPHFVAVEPDGSHWYVTLIGENKVVKFDLNDRVVGAYETETPGMLTIVPGTGLLLASRSMSAVNPPRRVAVIDRATMDGEEVDVLFPRPHPMAVSQGHAYTASLGVNQIASISLETHRARVIDVEGPTHAFVQFAVSPDGRTLVGTTEVSGLAMIFDLADPAQPALVTSIEVGAMAFDPVFTPDGSAVWVPVKSTNEIAVIDASTWTVTHRLADPAFKQPHQVVFSPDGTTAFVTNNNKMDHMADPAHAGHDMDAMAGIPGGGAAALVVIDVATREVVETLELGRNLTGMGARGSR